MPKYKNVKEFVQPLTVNGKRLIVRPGEVVSVDKELDLSFTPFLQKVTDDTPTSQVASKVTKPIVTPVKQVPNVVPDINEIKRTIEDIKKSSDSITEEHQKYNSSIEARLKHIEDTQGIVLKRLDVLKTATETVNQALRNVEEIVYNNETFVIEEDEK